MTTPTTAAVPAQPDAPAFTGAQIASACMSYRHDFGLLEPDERAKIMFTAREWKRAFAKERQSAAQGAAERAVPAPMCLHCGATEGAHYIGRCGSVMGATRYTAPAHVQTPAQTEHVAADVSKNGRESNTAYSLPDFDTVEQHIYGACRRYITQDMLEPIHNLIREGIDADRASHAQAPAGAAPRKES